MTKSLIYVFDPLCGWCYGSLPRLLELAQVHPVTMVPGGLFANEGARLLDKGFAAHAWEADQKIGEITGQVFTETYHSKIIKGFKQRLDSTQATLAHTAVVMTSIGQGPQALQLIQEARYIHGKDITSAENLVKLLDEAGYAEAADLLGSQSNDLRLENNLRIEQGKYLLAQVNSNGVPALIFRNGELLHFPPSSILYDSSAKLHASLKNF